MKNSYWSSCLYPIFLSSLSSCTYSKLAELELQNELDMLAERAIARFKYPKINLSYEYDSELEEGIAKGYHFLNDVSFKEINVILSWMKVYWLEYQLSQERNYKNIYSDKDVKAFSSGNLINSIEKSYRAAWDFAKQTEEDYYRVNSEGKPAIGDINSDEV